MRDWYGIFSAPESVMKSYLGPTAIVRPSDAQPFIRMIGSKCLLDVGVWGFSPPRGKSRPLINARFETVDVLPTFRDSFLRFRCLVPVTGYYEWQEEGCGYKRPWRFILKSSEDFGGYEDRKTELFVLAGLFSLDPRTNQRHFVIVTTEPNAKAAKVHDRMPVILDDVSMKVWLSPDSGLKSLKRVCRPYEGPDFYAEAVSKDLHKRPKTVAKNQLSLGL
mgnify:CR=1 FL=1